MLQNSLNKKRDLERVMQNANGMQRAVLLTSDCVSRREGTEESLLEDLGRDVNKAATELGLQRTSILQYSPNNNNSVEESEEEEDHISTTTEVVYSLLTSSGREVESILRCFEYFIRPIQVSESALALDVVDSLSIAVFGANHPVLLRSTSNEPH